MSPQQWHALFAQGIVIKDVSHKFFTQSFDPPPAGSNDVHSINSVVDMNISLDGGASYQFVRAQAPITVGVGAQGSGNSGFYDTEMLSLSLSGLPGGVMLRESPSLPSRGGTEAKLQADGSYRIGSFFDIFTEISLDGGASWSAATNGPVRMELTDVSPEQPKPNPNLPPLDGTYISPQKWHALYANGIIVTNASHDRFLQNQPPPPPGGSQTENFGSQVHGLISMNGGASFQPFSAPANVVVQVSSSQDSGPTRFFNTEMLSLSLSGGNLPGGVMVRESPSKASLGRTSVRTTASDYRIGSFFDIFTEVSLDGGATWSPSVTAPGTMGLGATPTNTPVLTITCPADITVYATSPAGAVVFYTVNTSGGCPPVSVVANPPSGSTFPVGTTTVTATATDGCGQSATCTFHVTVKPPVPEYFQPTPLLPPPNSVYISPALWHVLYNSGIVIRDIRHRFFTQNFPPPPLGVTDTHSFGSELDYEISFDNGATFTPGTGTAQVTVRITHSQDAGGQSFYDTEMLQLDLLGTGFMLRESPTLQSIGKTSVRVVPGGYMISSFFDINTEISTDGGVSWMPDNGPGHVELRNDPETANPTTHPTDLVPPPVGEYVSPQQWHALYAQGIVISNVSHKFFTDSQPPPPTGSNSIHTFNSTLDLDISTDNGAHFQFVRATAPVMVSMTAQGSSSSGFYDTEMLQLNVSGLPNGIMIRESPSLPSRGGTTARLNGLPPGEPDVGTFRIGSFFDIFTEISLDGGASWSAATNGPVRMQLKPAATEVPKPTPNLPPPDGNYVSPQQWHALYAQGIIITNASHDRFTQTQPPPPPGGSQTETFGSRVRGLISMDGGATFQPFSAPASVSVQVSSSQNSGNTRYFNTEMLSLSLSGGNLPGGVMVRESPSKASLGRTSIRQRPNTNDYAIGSFFDIFTELSLDGGATWSPQTNQPGTMGLSSNSVTVNCSSNITVTAAGCTNGATVFFSSSATGGCAPATVTCSPPSGSFFPIGTTTVTCTACDACGVCDTCSFTVTVNPPSCPPLVLTCSSNIVVTSTNCGSAGVTVFYSSSATGGCTNPTVVCNPPSGSTFPVGTTTVTCTASDGCHSTNCSFTVTVNPCPAVVLTCSSNIVVNATNCGAAGANVFYSSSATGGCGPLSVSCNPPSGSFFPIGTTTVTCTAFNCGVVATNCSFTVTVNPPVCPPLVLTCSSNITVTSTNCGSAGVVVFYSSTASGGCNPPPSLFCTPPSGSTFPIGTTTVTCTASNSCGQFTNCSFTVTVNPCPPVVLTCSSNIVVNATNCGAGAGANVFYTSTVSGGCGATVSCNPPSGSFFPIGTTTVTCSAFNCGVVVTNCSFTVTVKPPVCPPIVVNCSSNIVVTTPGCTPTNATVFYSSSASGGCPPTIVTCNPPSGSSFPPGVTTVFCTATDNCGNSNVCSFTVTVTNSGGVCPPIVLTCSSNITVNATNCSGSVPVFFSSSATGGCGVVTVSCNPPSGSSFPVNASTLVTCTATDSCGHTTNCTFAVTVNGPHCSPIVLNCPKKIKVVTHKHFGAFVTWTSTATGGCPPTTVTCSPPSGSFFPIGTTLVTCTATDACGNHTNCSFTVTVIPQHFVISNLLPVTNTVYISPATWHVLYNNGIVIRDVRHRFFTQSFPPPPLGTTQTHTFDSQLDFELSTDNGNTFQGVSAPATTTASVTHSSDDEGIESYDTEMLSLDVQGLPNGIRLRESPTLQSLGQTSIEPTPGGFMVSSFFDIFTEISLDNGATWTAADDSGSVEMRNDPRAVPPGTVPSSLLPPPNGAYVSPQQWHALYAQGIVIKDVKHKFFTQSLQPPPSAGSNTESFNSTLDMQVSTDGGLTFQYVRAAAPVTVTVSSVGSGNSGMYETEMTSLDLTVQAGGQTLKIRESPTLPSRGGTQIDSQPDGTFRINSFFDIFTELSLDGGSTWAPTTNGPVRVEFTPQTIEVPSPTPNLPQTNAPYISPQQWHALYANGIIITNVSHSKFLQTQPPPPPGSNQLETFSSTVDGQISTDGGHTFTPFSATANVVVQVNSRADQDNGSTRFFDTEMLSLDVQGLPGGIRLRESPSKASLGRTSIRTTPEGFRIGSFFDIFTEISLDGGATWSPSTTPPATMTPRLPARKRYFPRPNMPPTNGQYISPKQWHALYANGVIVSNVTHRRFLDNFPPPPKNATNTHNFNSQVNFLLKLPGQPFMPMTANANCMVSVGSSGFQSKEQVYQTEMLALNLSGGSLPPGVMIRESPTRRSTGETHYSGGGSGGYRIGSFFDIFTEVSLDNGQTWSPASSAGSMELHIDPGVPPTTIVKPRINAGTPTFTVPSQLGLQYLLQYKNDLLDATWTTISITKGNGGDLDLIDCCPPPGPSRPHRFYQVEVQEDDTY